MSSTEIEYYRNTDKKQLKLKAFQKIVALFKINSINFCFSFSYVGLPWFVVVAYQFWEIHLPIPTWNQDTYQKI